jgi:N-acetylmuramoyl-L-alanine amidase
MTRRIAISSGHSKYCRGASASPNPEPYNDEVDEVRKIVDEVYELLTEAGHTCVKFHDDNSTSQSANLNAITSWHNKQSRDLDVSVHLNANAKTSNPMGCEVLWYTQETLAREVSAAIAAAGHFKDRGPKYRDDLAFLNNTSKPAILLECWFCDSSADCANGRQYWEAICHAIAEKIAAVDLDEVVPPEPPEPEPEPPDVTGDNRVAIRGAATGDVQCLINGSTVYGVYKQGQPVVDLFIEMTGDVVVVLNGEEFHNKPEPDGEGISDNHTDIEATVFGGSGDPNNSAYPPYDALGDSELYVALPVNVTDAAKRDRGVKVWSHGTQINAVAKIRDKGPWMVDDNDYVDGTARPMAETCHDEGAPLPRGPNAGMVPSNRAGIDLSPALARALGISGKGVVDWEFVDG